jgi:ABC-type transporter Mla subunit MlaD
MSSLVAYKAALAVLLVITGASSGGITYYFQQRTSELNTQVANLDDQLDTSNSQISSLNGQISSLNSQISQLQSLNTQLQNQIAQLQSQIDELTQRPQVTRTLISQGTIYLAGFGAVAYVPFTLSSDMLPATLNISMSTTSDVRISLLNQSQYDVLNTCNCIFEGNYTSIPTTWSSPWVTSYTTSVDLPHPGAWYVAFQMPPGTGSERNITVALNLLEIH